MRNFTVFVDEMTDKTRPNALPSYMIALSPSSITAGAMATKQYSASEYLAQDLKQRLRYTEAAIARFFTSEDKHQVLMNHALTDEDAAYLGWLPEYNRN